MITILTLDLNNDVSSAVRDLMYAELGKLNYVKNTALTTIWQKSWKDGSQTADYVGAVKNDVAQAATAAKVLRYDASVIVTPNAPVTWKVAPAAAPSLWPPASQNRFNIR